MRAKRPKPVIYKPSHRPLDERVRAIEERLNPPPPVVLEWDDGIRQEGIVERDGQRVDVRLMRWLGPSEHADREPPAPPTRKYSTPNGPETAAAQSIASEPAKESRPVNLPKNGEYGAYD